MRIVARFLHIDHQRKPVLPLTWNLRGQTYEGAQVLPVSKFFDIIVRGEDRADDWYRGGGSYPTFAFLKVKGFSGEIGHLNYKAVLPQDVVEMRVMDISALPWMLMEIAGDMEDEGFDISMDQAYEDPHWVFEFEDEVALRLWKEMDRIRPIWIEDTFEKEKMSNNNIDLIESQLNRVMKSLDSNRFSSSKVGNITNIPLPIKEARILIQALNEDFEKLRSYDAEIKRETKRAFGPDMIPYGSKLYERGKHLIFEWHIADRPGAMEFQIRLLKDRDTGLFALTLIGGGKDIALPRRLKWVEDGDMAMGGLRLLINDVRSGRGPAI